MKKLNLVLKVLLSLSFLFFLVTCNDTKDGTLHDVTTYLFPEGYWGEWVRMDTGDNWYFAGKYWKVGTGSRKSSLDAGMTLERQSQNVIKVTEGTGANLKEYYLYASRIRNSSFEAKAVQDVASEATAVQGVASKRTRSGAGRFSRDATEMEAAWAKIRSKENGSDTQQTKTDKEGVLVASDIIAGDDYIVTIDGYEFIVTPNTDGDNVGTLTLTNGVNIKTSVVLQSSDDNVDLMRLYSGQSYELKIIFSNIGKDISTAMRYQLTVPPTGITITKIGNSTTQLSTGIIPSIMPGKSQEVVITIFCGSISEDFEFKEIAISTEDYDGKKWDDSISLKVNKTSVTFNIRSESNKPINGVVIVPSGKTYHFKTSWSNNSSAFSADVTVPKYTKDYLVVFSGATPETETIYSFAVDNVPSVDFNADNFDWNKYRYNTTESNAAQINPDQKVMSYLVYNRATYFKVRFTN